MGGQNSRFRLAVNEIYDARTHARHYVIIYRYRKYFLFDLRPRYVDRLAVDIRYTVYGLCNAICCCWAEIVFGVRGACCVFMAAIDVRQSFTMHPSEYDACPIHIIRHYIICLRAPALLNNMWPIDDEALRVCNIVARVYPVNVE